MKILSKIPFERKYNEDIMRARKMTPQQKMDLIAQLYLLSWELMEAKDKEKKLKYYHAENELKKQNLIKFIKTKLENEEK